LIYQHLQKKEESSATVPFSPQSVFDLSKELNLWAVRGQFADLSTKAVASNNKKPGLIDKLHDNIFAAIFFYIQFK